MTARRAVVVGAAGVVWFLALAAVVPIPEGVTVAPFDDYGERISGGQLPYRDFSLEYPPGAIPVIALPAVFGSYDTAFRVLQALLGASVVAGVAVLLRGASLSRLVVGVGVVASLPVLLGPVLLHRYDLWPTALVLWSIVAVEAARTRTSAALLGVAIAAKAWAAALVLPFAAYAGGRLGRDPLRAGGAVVLSSALVLLPFALVGLGGVAHSLVRQGSRDLQLESVAASVVLVSDGLGWASAEVGFSSGSWNLTGPTASMLALLATIAGAAVVAALWVLLWRSRADVGELRTAYAAIVAVVLVFAKVLSPQFLLWLVPLVAVVPGAAGVYALALTAVACLLTQLIYPGRYEELVAKEAGPVALLVTRNALLVLVAVLLVRAIVAGCLRRGQEVTLRPRAAG